MTPEERRDQLKLYLVDTRRDLKRELGKMQRVQSGMVYRGVKISDTFLLARTEAHLGQIDEMISDLSNGVMRLDEVKVEFLVMADEIQDMVQLVGKEELNIHFQTIQSRAMQIAVDQADLSGDAALDLITARVKGIELGHFKDVVAGLREAQLESLAKSIAAGQSPNELAASLQKMMEARGIAPPPGFTGSLEGYTQMVARTLRREADEAATRARMDELGLDLIEIGRRGALDACIHYEGMICSQFGKDTRYPRLFDLPGYGSFIFHPNCAHTYTAWIPQLKDPGQIKEAQARSDQFQAMSQSGEFEDKMKFSQGLPGKIKSGTYTPDEVNDMNRFITKGGDIPKEEAA